MEGFGLKFSSVLLVLLALCATSALAAPPFQSSEGILNELTVVYPQNEFYAFGQDIRMHFHVYNDSGIKVSQNVTCVLDLYNATGVQVLSKNLTPTGNEFYIDLNTTTLNSMGRWSYTADCTQLSIAGFLSGFFVINAHGNAPSDEASDLTPIAVLIALPMLLALLLLIGAATLDGEDHAAMKIGLFLASALPFYISTYIGGLTLVHYFIIPQLQEAVADGIWWLGSLWGVIIVYFLIYAFYKATHKAAQKKEERLRY